MKITGTVTFVDLAGGFWGILGADGQQYQPTSPLPADLCQEGKKITAKVRPANGMSIFMWGNQVDVQTIQAAN